MRKETIRANLKQFNDWICEEDILVGFPSYMQDDSIGKLSWKKVNDFSDWNALDTKFIINDFAVELRKAIAENKTILFWKLVEQGLNCTDIYKWVELHNIDVNYCFEYDLNLYKIK